MAQGGGGGGGGKHMCRHAAIPRDGLGTREPAWAACLSGTTSA